MKSMFDIWYGGKLNSRQVIAEKIRAMKVEGSVISETVDAVESRSAADQVEAFVQFNQDNKYKVVRSEKSAPYVGERY